MKRGTPDHPKTAALAQALGCHRLMAIGLLEQLWHWTARYASRGDVGRWPDQTIAQGVYWDGDAVELVSALVKTGWLDACGTHRLVVHDWAQHADEAVKKGLSRNNLTFAVVSRQRRDKVRTVSATLEESVAPAVAVAVAVPEPSQSQSLDLRPASPTAIVSGSDWNREAADDFRAAYGGPAPKQFFAQVKPIAKQYGWAKTRPALQAYMAETELEYLAIPKCLAVLIENGNGARAPARNPKAQQRVNGLNALIAGGMKGDGT